MTMMFNLHGEAHAVASLAQLEQLLAHAHTLAQCELWLTMASEPEQGAALCLLRNGGNAWLMYVSPDDDASAHSLGDDEEEGDCSYLMANGQVDLYPDAWCIDLALCHQAMREFFSGKGKRPAGIAWQAD